MDRMQRRGVASRHYNKWHGVGSLSPFRVPSRCSSGCVVLPFGRVMSLEEAASPGGRVWIVKVYVNTGILGMKRLYLYQEDFLSFIK